MARILLTKEEIAERQKAASKRYYEANREKSLARVAAYRAANPEKIAAYKLVRKEEINAYQAQWCKNNPTRRAEYVAKHEAKPERKTRHLRYTPEQKAARVQTSRQWQARNPDIVRIVISQRRARKQTGKLTRGLVSKLLKLQKCLCINCRINIKADYHVDHIEPLASGGQHSDNNIQLLCPTCNMKKGAKDPFVWANTNGRLL